MDRISDDGASDGPRARTKPCAKSHGEWLPRFESGLVFAKFGVGGGSLEGVVRKEGDALFVGGSATHHGERCCSVVRRRGELSKGGRASSANMSIARETVLSREGMTVYCTVCCSRKCGMWWVVSRVVGRSGGSEKGRTERRPSFQAMRRFRWDVFGSAAVLGDLGQASRDKIEQPQSSGSRSVHVVSDVFACVSGPTLGSGLVCRTRGMQAVGMIRPFPSTQEAVTRVGRRCGMGKNVSCSYRVAVSSLYCYRSINTSANWKEHQHHRLLKSCLEHS